MTKYTDHGVDSVSIKNIIGGSWPKLNGWDLWVKGILEFFEPFLQLVCKFAIIWK